MRNMGFINLIQERTFFPCNHFSILRFMARMCTIKSPDFAYIRSIELESNSKNPIHPEVPSEKSHQMDRTPEKVRYHVIPHS